MADFMQSGGATRFHAHGVDTAASLGVLVTASASANTKGSYAQITASSEFDAKGLLICFSKIGVATRYWVDIAIGGAGSEVVIISNVLLRNESVDQVSEKMYFPIAVPAGTRISARCQSSSGSLSVYVSCIICSGGLGDNQQYSGVESIGLNPDTDGTFYLTSGLATNTKSAWQQMTAATTHNIKAIDIVFTHFWATADAYHVFDIGIGGSGAEQVLIPNITDCSDITTPTNRNNTGVLPCVIPAGTRVSYRGQSTTTGTNRFFVLAIYGYY